MTIDRKKQKGTWINEEMIAAYTKLHSKGYAHSIEVYDRDKLVGGLYGVCLGKIFYGESMFAQEPNTSKMALIALCLVLQEDGFWIIDCQQDTEHIQSMGAETIGQDHFRKLLIRNVFETQIDPDHLNQYDPYELWYRR